MDLKNWVREAAIRPRWIPYHLGNALRRRADRTSHINMVDQFPNYVVPLPDALGKILAVPPAEIAAILDGYSAPELASSGSNIPQAWSASHNLLQIYFVICRVLKPHVVVETGVATGISSALLLRELARIESARLISIEMPGLGRADLTYIGSSVPSHLKSNWTPVVAPAVPALRNMRNLFGKVDIFIHDSDHAYDNQLREYRIAMTLLAPGGILVSDDVNNDAFLEICRASELVPVLVHRREQQGHIGLTRKPR